VRRRAAGLLVLLALVGGAGVARAEDVVFDAQLSADSVTMDGTVQLTIQLIVPRGTRHARFVPPDLHEFDVQPQGVQQSMQWSSGKKGSEVREVETRTFGLRPKRRGLLRVGEARVTVSGREYQTSPLTVRAGAAADAPDGGAAPEKAPDKVVQRGELFLRTTVDRQRVYVGEQLKATFSLFTKSDILKYRTIAEPKTDGFWSEELFSPQGRLSYERRTVGGVEYSVAVLLKRALFPLQPGRLTIGTMESEVTTFTTAFYSAEGQNLKSEPIAIEVRPLPEAGKPAGFVSQNVGKFALTAHLDRDTLSGGEAAALTVTVRGEGNLRGIKLKTPQVEGLRVYEPKITERIEPGDLVGGTKIYEFLVLPQKAGKLEIPPMDLPYFDPKLEKYAVARTERLTVNVTGLVSASSAQPGTGPSASGAGVENVLAPEIRTIRARRTLSSRVGAVLYRHRAFRIILIVPALLFLAVVLFERVRGFLKRETRRALLRKAKWSARGRLRVAEGHVKAGRAAEFWGEIDRAIREYIGAQLGLNVTGRTLAELRETLEARGYAPEMAAEVVGQLEACDFARFAQVAPGAAEMRNTAKQARALLDQIERVRVKDAA